VLRVYLDSSVVGGAEDPEFAAASRALVEIFERGAALAVASATLAAEIAPAPEAVREILRRILAAGAETIVVTDEVLDLRNAYLDANVVGHRYADDALHVAHATVTRADVIASWNFSHLVNPTRIRAFNGVNVAKGYGLVVIMTPADILGLMEATDE
jgi:hypothetical protein